MNVRRWLWRAGFLGLLALAGCASQERSHARNAATPEEKTRQEQLDRMADEDAERAGVKRQRSSPRTIEQREDNQRVIDQPRVR